MKNYKNLEIFKKSEKIEFFLKDLKKMYIFNIITSDVVAFCQLRAHKSSTFFEIFKNFEKFKNFDKSSKKLGNFKEN